MSDYVSKPSGARGGRLLKHAIPKPAETTETDKIQSQRHATLLPREVRARLTPNQKLATKWPQLTYGAVPEVDLKTYFLEILVEGKHVTEFSLGGLLAHPAFKTFSNVDFHCVTGWSALDMTFDGVNLVDLFNSIGVNVLDPRYKRIFSYCSDHFTGSLQTHVAPDAFIALRALGQPLEPKHGGPVRIVTPTRYQFKGAKWIYKLDLITEDTLGFWEIRGYDDLADPWKEQRFAGATGKDGLTQAQRAKHQLKKNADYTAALKKNHDPGR